MALNFWSFCLHLSSVGIAGEHYHFPFVWTLELEPKTLCMLGKYSTEPYPSAPHIHFNANFCSIVPELEIQDQGKHWTRYREIYRAQSVHYSILVPVPPLHDQLPGRVTTRSVLSVSPCSFPAGLVSHDSHTLYRVSLPPNFWFKA